MLIPVLMAAILGSGPVLLECKAASRHTPGREDAPYSIVVVLSFNPELYHVETRGPDFRTSTMGVGTTHAEWWWDDWQGHVLGRSRINRKTLAYRVDRGTRHLAGQCQKRGAPVWPLP